MNLSFFIQHHIPEKPRSGGNGRNGRFLFFVFFTVILYAVFFAPPFLTASYAASTSIERANYSGAGDAVVLPVSWGIVISPANKSRHQNSVMRKTGRGKENDVRPIEYNAKNIVTRGVLVYLRDSSFVLRQQFFHRGNLDGPVSPHKSRLLTMRAGWDWGV